MKQSVVHGRWSVVRGLLGTTAFFFLLSTIDCRPPTVFAAEEPVVRVAILQEAESARLTVLNPCRLIDLKDGALLAEWPHIKWKEVQAGNPGLRIGDHHLPSQTVLLEIQGEGIFRINAQPYRGSLILYRTPKGKLTVVNRLDLEGYLVGALISETDPKWPLEALEAHAVVSRTMAAHSVWISKDKPFDMTADTSTHLYHGVNAERQRTREAVQQTRGQVLAYAGELVSATFHANCGGHTEDAAELWQEKREIPPLTGRADPYCRGLRHFRWEMKLPVRELERKLNEAESDPGQLQALEILERNRSGRVRQIRLVGSRGEAILTGRKLRELLGANRLRSLNFTAAISGDTIIFQGFGWGHGVGFCQWGAYGAARKGKKAEEILRHYFPGTQQRRLQGLPGFS